MKKNVLFFTFICLFCNTTYAQFSNAYEANLWTTTLSPGSTGTIDLTGVPNSIVINGSDGAQSDDFLNTDFTIQAAVSGAWSFSWSYLTFDGSQNPFYDPVFVLINGVETALTIGTFEESGQPSQSGVYNGIANVGDVIGFRVRSNDNIQGRGVLTISSFTAPGGVLPIKLTSFKATPKAGQIKLDWSTGSESESNRFEIERSVNGKDFEKIGTVKSAGNSQKNQNYSFTDKAPGFNNNYYRLRHFDNDNTFYESEIIVCRISNENRVEIYPNPAQNLVYLSLNHTGILLNATVSLFNSEAKLVETRKVYLPAQENNTLSWNIAGLPAGMYYFKFEKSGSVYNFLKN